VALGCNLITSFFTLDSGSSSTGDDTVAVQEASMKEQRKSAMAKLEKQLG